MILDSGKITLIRVFITCQLIEIEIVIHYITSFSLFQTGHME